MNTTYIYHYFADFTQGNKITSIDGILHLENKVTDMENYHYIKKLILDQPGTNDIPTNKLVIKNLSFLHKIDEE